MTREGKTKITPVYFKSANHIWVPALQLKSASGKAVVSVPKFKDEKDKKEFMRVLSNKIEQDKQQEYQEYIKITILGTETR